MPYQQIKLIKDAYINDIKQSSETLHSYALHYSYTYTNNISHSNDTYILSKEFNFLYDLLPTDKALYKELSNLAHDNLTKPHTHSFRPLNNYDERTVKFKHVKFLPDYAWFSNQVGPRIACSLTLMFHVYNVEVRNWLFHQLNHLNIFGLDEEEIVKSLKTVNIIAKKGGRRLFGDNWRYLIDLDRMVGYIEGSSDDEDIIGQVTSFVQSNISHSIDGDESRWLDLFSIGCDKFLHAGVKSTKGLKSLDDWLLEPANWGSSGTSYSGYDFIKSLATISVESGGKQLKIKDNKSLSGLFIDPQIIKEIMLSDVGQSASAVLKHEPSKVRVVISSGLELAWKMAYVLDVIRLNLDRSAVTPLFMTFEDKWHAYNNIINSIRTGDVQCPLDWEHFDWQVNAKMLRRALLSIKKIARGLTTDESKIATYERVVDSIIFGIVDNPGFVSMANVLHKDINVAIHSGLLSGWFLTSLLGTMINYASCYVVRQIHFEVTGSELYTNEIYQGDDSVVSFSNLLNACLFMKSVKATNIQANLRKNYFSKSHSEFLRYLFEDDSILGVPCRAINAIVWRKPTSSEGILDTLKGSEIFSNWCLLKSRCRGLVNLTEFTNLLIYDIAYGLHLSIKDAKNYLGTPLHLGGLGGESLVDASYYLSLKPGVKKLDLRVISNPKGLSKMLNMAKALGVDEEKLVNDIVSARITSEKLRLQVTDRSLLTSKLSNGVKLTAYEVDLNVIRGTTSNISPKWIDSMPVTGRTELILNLLRSKRMDQIYQLLKEKSKDIMLRLWVYGSRRIVADWLTGNLPYYPPKNTDWNSALVSNLYEKNLQKQLKKLLFSGSTFTWQDINIVAASVSYSLRHALIHNSSGKLSVFFSD